MRKTAIIFYFLYISVYTKKKEIKKNEAYKNERNIQSDLVIDKLTN